MHRLDYIGILAILLLLGFRESTDLYTQIPAPKPFPALGTDDGPGSVTDGVLTLDLTARDDAWLVREEGAEPVAIPWDVAPSLRDDDPITPVPQGALVRARIHNDTSTPLEVSGPWGLDGKSLERLVIPAHAEDTAWFVAGDRGRFEYVAVPVGESGRDPRRFGGGFVVVGERERPR